jgi:3-isopropylmalate/(R)-2-methylmalate dehydratase small subunit
VKPFTQVRAIAAPLPFANVTTDDIFPSAPATKDAASAMTGEPEEMGPNAFGNLRWMPDGSARPEFILNRAPYDRAGILVVGDNFGCGSSREHAVWCLSAIGIRSVIAPSFGDIFFGNLFKNGMLPIILGAATIEGLLALVSVPSTAEIAIDLEHGTVTDALGTVVPFHVDPYHRRLLLAGWDEVDLTLNSLPEIARFERAYSARRPWLNRKG